MKKLLLTLLCAVTVIGLYAENKVLDFVKDNYSKSVQDYTSTWTTKSSQGDIYSLVNFNNNQNSWDFVKCGSKSAASVATITSPQFTEVITEVKVTLGAASTANATVTLQTSNDNTNWADAGTFTNIKGVQSVKLSNPAANLYYQIKFDCKKKSNGFEQVNKVEYVIKDGTGAPEAVKQPEFTPASGTPLYADDKVTVKCDTEGATLSYTVNGQATDYPEGGFSFSVDGTYTIVATATKGDLTPGTATATYKYAAERPKSIGAVRVTSADNVIEGASYVLALNGQAMGNTLGKSFINSVSATYNEDKTLQVTEDLGIVKFEPSTLADDEGKWHLKVQNYGENGGYIKKGTGNNSCTISDTPEHSAGISFYNMSADDVRVEIEIAEGTNKYYLAANNSAKRFSCYDSYDTSSKSRPCLYALPAESVEAPVVTMPEGYKNADNVDLEVFSKGYEGENAWFVITVTWNPGLKLHYETTSLGSEVDDVKIKFPSTGSSTGTDTPAKAAAKVAASHDITVGNKATFKFGSEGMFTCYTVDAAGNRAEAAPFSVNFKGESTGVEDITVDDQNGVAVYYNMQGVRVANPAAGGLYIKVEGKKATKVLVK